MINHLPKTFPVFLWHFLKHYKRVVFVFIFLAIAAGLWGPLNSVLIKHLINLLPAATHGHTTILMIPAALVVINFIVFDNVTWRSINYIWAKYLPVLQNKMVAEILEYTLSHSFDFYQNNLSGKLAKQISNLVDNSLKIISFRAASFFRGISLLCTAFVAAYFANPIFCIILVTWFALFAGFSISMSKKMVRFSDDLALQESIVNGELVDALSNHNNVRMFSRTSYEHLRMKPFFAAQQQAYTKTYMYLNKLASIQGGLIGLMMAFSCYFLVHLYGKGLISVGDFALILGLSMETGHMMWFTMSEVDEFNKSLGSCKQSLSALMTPIEILDKPHAKTLICHKGSIKFDNVKFSYKGAVSLFQNKTVDIKPGEKIGLVGYSGGGKSTFVNLIQRLHDVIDGAILIDGQDVRDVTQDSLRQSIAMIPQDPTLFNRSLMDNIRYGRIEASDEEVITAAKKAYAHEFIEKLAEGYDALVGERGVKLSGGQRQRIAIARAILKNAPILILDEATSQLDSVTEGLIQESLWELMQNKTTLVIAHRLSTLLHMDRILVFEKGHIVEDGSHDELLQRGGLYKTLWDAQVGGFLYDSPKE